MTSKEIATLKDGQYRLTAAIGRGTFSRTFRAINQESKRQVIVKTFANNLVTHHHFEQFKQKFWHLAQRLSHCQHENLARVLDLFEEKSRPYLVYEYIPGKNLREIIKSKGAIAEKKALKYISQVAVALAVLHRGNIVHQDLKPENLIYNKKTGKVVLVDVGLVCELTPAIRKTYADLLSTGYAPMEQYLLDKATTPATDIYALAATLYSFLTGEPPTPAPLRVNPAVPKDLRKPFAKEGVGKKISPQVKEAIVRGLEINPEQRPRTVVDWLSLLTPPQPQKQKKRTAPPVQPVPSRSKAVPQTTAQESKLSSNGSKPKSKAVAANAVPKTSEQSELEKATNEVKRTKFPIGALMMTIPIAGAAGLGFGLAIRLNRPDEPGSTIFHLEQSFPERSDWQADDPSEKDS